MKEALTNTELVGIGISNCCALEIIDDKYRLLRCDASNYGIDSYGVKAYYKDKTYHLEEIENSSKYKPLNELLTI
jgi:hypothetical protein